MRSIGAILQLLAMTAATAASQSSNGVVEGTVTRYGTTEPIAGVEIALKAADAPASAPEAVTDARGRFILRDVPPGKYTIQASRNGYVNPAPNGIRLRDGGTVRPVVVGPRQHVEDANLALAPGGVIAGRIVGRDGKPAPALAVCAALAPDEVRCTHGATTDERGQFRIFDLEAGQYRVSVESRTDSIPIDSAAEAVYSVDRPVWMKAYFPGVTDIAQAEQLQVVEGQVLSGIDFSLPSTPKTFFVSGTLISPIAALAEIHVYRAYLVPSGTRTPTYSKGPNGGSFASDYSNEAARNSGPPNAGEVRDPERIDFKFNGVRPGEYDLFVAVGGPYSSDCCDIAGRTALQVSSQDVEGLTVIAGGVDVRGRVVVTGNTTAKPTASIALALVPQDIRTRQVKPNASGEFTIPGVPGGAWKALVSDLPPGVAVAEVRQGRESVYETGLDVEDSSPAPLEVILAAAGSIEGIIYNSERRPAAGARIVLVPAAPNQSAALHRTATADAAGRFTIAAAVAGEYEVFGFVPAAFPAQSIPASPAALRAFLAAYMPASRPLNVTVGNSVVIEVTAIDHSFEK